MSFMKISLVALLAATAQNYATEEKTYEKLLGNITIQQAHDFVFGLGLGSAHGIINKLVKSEKNAESKIDEAQEAATFGCATIIQAAHDNKEYNNATTLGRAIGQMFFESIIPDKQTGKAQFELNVALIATIAYSIYKLFQVSEEKKDAPASPAIK